MQIDMSWGQQWVTHVVACKQARAADAAPINLPVNKETRLAALCNRVWDKAYSGILNLLSTFTSSDPATKEEEEAWQANDKHHHAPVARDQYTRTA